MKKTVLLIFAFLSVVIPLTAGAFETVRWDNGTELTIYGFLQNNSAMFTQNPNPWGPTGGQSGNRLAIERTWLRTNIDLKLSDQFRFYVVGQWAYEPWLPVEQSNGPGARKASMGNGNEYSMYKNVNDVLREVYFEWKPNAKNDVRIGRMNVIWGETITGRVGDVVNPTDIRWTLPYSLEPTDDLRIPQYMIRGMHDIEPLNSSIEWIVSPIITSPEWSVSMADQPASLFLNQAGQRFGMAPETRYLPPRTIGNTAVALLDPNLAPYADFNVVDASPFNSAWNFSPLNPGNGWSPSLIEPNLFTGNTRITNEIPDVRVKYPDGIENTRFGLRTATTLGGFNFGAIYYHRQVFEPVIRREGVEKTDTVSFPTGPATSTTIVNKTRQYTVEYPDIENIGFYMNKQLPWPGVIRAEVMYTPNMPFNYFLPTVQSTVNLGPFSVPITRFADESGVTKRDDFKYLIAYDLTGFLYFDWHKTAPINITFEHVGEWIPNARELQYIGVGVNYATKLPSWQGNFNLNITTDWFYGKISTGMVLGYGTFGKSWLAVPSVKWTPGWMDKKFSTELKYVYTDAQNRYEGLGVWKDKNFIQLKAQLAF